MELIGVIFDEYSPSVESQLTRDIIALKSAYPRSEFEVRCDTDDPETLLRAFNVDMNNKGDPSLFLVYRTTEQWPPYPDENTHTVILRDLYVTEAYPTLSGEPSVGYYVPREQGRPIRDQLPLSRMGPKGKGAVDPAILLLWGGGEI